MGLESEPGLRGPVVPTQGPRPQAYSALPLPLPACVPVGAVGFAWPAPLPKVTFVLTLLGGQPQVTLFGNLYACFSVPFALLVELSCQSQ